MPVKSRDRSFHGYFIRESGKTLRVFCVIVILRMEENNGKTASDHFDGHRVIGFPTQLTEDISRDGQLPFGTQMGETQMPMRIGDVHTAS